MARLASIVAADLGELIASGVEIRPIPGHENFVATSSGEIINIKHQYLNGRPGFVHRRLRPDGYYSCKIKGIGFLVHRLVAIAFHGLPPFPKAIVRHLDDNKQNNTPANLMWGTQIDNMEDARRNGTLAIGETSGTCRINETIVAEIKQRLLNGETTKSISKNLEISVDIVRDVRKGKTWVHVLTAEEKQKLELLRGPIVGNKHHNTKHTESEIFQLKTRLAHGEMPGKVGEEYGLTSTTVSKIAKGITWSHVELDSETQKELNRRIKQWRLIKGDTSLTPLKIDEISNAITTTNLSYRKIARKFGVSREMVSCLAKTLAKEGIVLPHRPKSRLDQ